MRFNAETVAGRRVTTDAGGFYTFRRDGSFDGRIPKGVALAGRWAVQLENTIRVTYRNGDYWDYSSYLVDGQAYLMFVSGRQRQTSRIKAIEPAG